MDILKRLMNVVTLVWVALTLFCAYLFLTFPHPSHSDKVVMTWIAFGWLPILLINYILFHKVTLWNKT